MYEYDLVYIHVNDTGALLYASFIPVKQLQNPCDPFVDLASSVLSVLCWMTDSNINERVYAVNIHSMNGASV